MASESNDVAAFPRPGESSLDASTPETAALPVPVSAPASVPVETGGVAELPCAVPESPPAALPQPVAHSCSFTGVASDYFRIWIVNLLLTLVTLGLWSPWAKVRKRRYFYGHTWVAEANFEYHGNPLVILRGRLLAAAAFGVYWVVDHLRPGAGPLLLIVLMAGAPWIIARSVTFNAVNSSHRGIRFGFDIRARTVAAAIWPMFLWPGALYFATFDPVSRIDNSMLYVFGSLFVYVVLMGVYPYAIARVRRLTIEHARWGQRRFASTLRPAKVYAIYGMALLLGMLGAALMGAVIFAVLWQGKVLLDNYPRAVVVAGYVWGGLAYVLLVVVVMGYTRSRMTNLVFNTARLVGVARFRSTVSARKLAKLYAGNLALIFVTCGLMIPWAVIRVARYRVESLAVILEGSLDEVTGAVIAMAGAAGEELSEVFGFDLAL